MKHMLLLLACAPMLALGADDPRYSYLEQEVRNLQRQVQALSREVDELRRLPARPGTRTAPGRAAPPPVSVNWVDARKWDAVRPGMSELQVLELLGPPTSMRDENGMRVLRYALEIGSSGFLVGSVALRDRVVTETRKPSLQ